MSEWNGKNRRTRTTDRKITSVMIWIGTAFMIALAAGWLSEIIKRASY